MSRPTSRRATVLELAILGLLRESPIHGYELRKRLDAGLGAFRALSYGTLYPCLRDLVAGGFIAGSAPTPRRLGPDLPPVGGTRRARIVYHLTDSGEARLEALLSDAGPAAWEDESFDVRFALFARTEAAVRLRILEGRRARLEERLEDQRDAVRRADALDPYAGELARHALDSAEREVRWLAGLTEAERARVQRDPATT